MARARLRVWLEQLCEGGMDVATFVDASAALLKSQDRGVIEIANFVSQFEDDLWPWGSFDDLDEKTRGFLRRCLRFLAVDNEYRWPPYPATSWLVAFFAFLAASYGMIATALGITLFILALSLLNIPFVVFTILVVASGVGAMWLLAELDWNGRQGDELKMRQYGDVEAWPFLTNAEHRAAWLDGHRIQYLPETSLPLSPIEEHS